VNWDIQPASRKSDVVVCQPQRVPVPPIIPVSKHPLRIGLDQAGSNRFRGQIARATAFRGTLSPERIRSLVAGGRAEKVTGQAVIGCLLDPKAGDILPSQPEDFAGGLSLEAWIQPEQGENGRIFDMLTGGQRDGFLLDCWPGQSLRLIVGPQQIDFDSVLKPGVWQHVVVVIDRHVHAVYLNGKELQR
jgi:hypothetical protein